MKVYGLRLGEEEFEFDERIASLFMVTTTTTTTTAHTARATDRAHRGRHWSRIKLCRCSCAVYPINWWWRRRRLPSRISSAKLETRSNRAYHDGEISLASWRGSSARAGTRDRNCWRWLCLFDERQLTRWIGGGEP
jgi:hypothetical protein